MSLSRDADPTDRGDGALGPLLLACAVAAIWIDLGTLHRTHNADSFLPALVSLQRWTPFYWARDRFGILVPLVALPFHDPFVNLLVQMAFDTFFALASMVLVAKYIAGGEQWPGAALTSCLTFLSLPVAFRFETIFQPFAPALALALGGLLAVEHHQRLRLPSALVSLALVGAAHWVNLSISLAVAPLVVFRSLLLRPPQAALRTSIALLGIGSIVGYALKRSSPFAASYAAVVPPEEWLEGVRRLIASTRQGILPATGVIVLVAAAGAGLSSLCLPRIRQRCANACRGAVAAGLAAAVYALPVATLGWVQSNLFAYRYWLPALLLLQGAFATLAAAPLGMLRWRLGSAWILIAGPALVLAATLSYGVPSISGVRRDLDRFGQYTPDVLASGATHVAGS